MYVSRLSWIFGHQTEEKLTVGTVEVRNSEDVSSTALRSAVESGAGGIRHLAVLNLNWGGQGNAGEDGSEGESELHGDCGSGWELS